MNQNIHNQFLSLIAAFSDHQDESAFVSQFARLLRDAVRGTCSGVLELTESEVDYRCNPEHLEPLKQHLTSEAFTRSAYDAMYQKRVCLIADGNVTSKTFPDGVEVRNDLLASSLPLESSLDQNAEAISFDTTDNQMQIGDGECFEGCHEATSESNRTVQIHHFFVPTFHKESSNSVIWIEVQSENCEQTNQIVERLDDLSLLSMASLNLGLRRSEVLYLEGQLKQAEKSLAQSRAMTADAKSINALSEHISAYLEKEKSGFSLANELRGFFDAERVTMVDLIGETYRAIAVSGQAVVNRRANIVRATQTMLDAIGLTDEAVFFEGVLDVFPASSHTEIQKFLDESLVTSFAVLPVMEKKEQVYESEEQSLIEVVNPGRTHRRKITGAVIVEYVTSPMDREKLERRWQQIRPIVENQHNNSKQYSELLFLPLQLMLTKFIALYRGHTKRIAFATTAAILLPIMLACIIPASFKVRCEGVMRPNQLTAMFSPEASTVASVHIKEGNRVTEGQVLVELSSPELAQQLAEAQGQLELSRAKLAANRHQRIAFLPADAQEREEKLTRLENEAAILELQLEDNQRIVKLLASRADALKVRAPFDGQIIGWNLDRKLLNRPLEAGVNMFSIAPLDANWILELKVPDKRAGHIRAAYANKAQAKLATEFTIVSNPNSTFAATLVHVNPGLEEDSDLGYVLPMEAIPDVAIPDDLRSGTPVIAKINCGRKSFMYCKCYEFLDWVNRALFEYL